MFVNAVMMLYNIILHDIQSYLAADDTLVDCHVEMPSEEDMLHYEEGIQSLE